MLTNEKIIASIAKSLETNAEYQSVIPAATTPSGTEVLLALDAYPTQKNIFINTLTNRVALTLFNTDKWSNPLKTFKKGKLPFGQTIEMLFVEDAVRKAFGEHFDGSTSEEGDIFGKVVPKVHANYISVNMKNKYKVSISPEQLQTAFTNEFGLNSLLNRLVQSIYEQAEVDEYDYMKYCVYNLIGSVATTDDETKTKMFVKIDEVKDEASAKKLLKNGRAYGGRLKFKSVDFNAAGVKTFTDIKKMNLLVTPETRAELDVEAFAAAFNIDKAELKYKIVEVDELPAFTDIYAAPAGNKLVDPSTGKYADIIQYEIADHLQNIKIDALLIDEDLLQFYDTVDTTRTTENANSLITNIILHKQGIAGANPYCNFVAFYHEFEVPVDPAD